MDMEDYKTKLGMIDEAAQQYMRGVQLMEAALEVIPSTRERALAVTYMQTGMLWAEQAFNGARQNIERARDYEAANQENS